MVHAMPLLLQAFNLILDVCIQVERLQSTQHSAYETSAETFRGSAKEQIFHLPGQTSVGKYGYDATNNVLIAQAAPTAFQKAFQLNWPSSPP
jgi:hypothetical protein